MVKAVYLYVNGEFSSLLDSSLDSTNTLIICYGSSHIPDIKQAINKITEVFPSSIVVGNSTAGEIYQDELYEKSLTVAVLKFEKTSIGICEVHINESMESFNAGSTISKTLQSEQLKSILIFSNGLNINGSQLTKGINTNINANVMVAGGLAGDDANFKKTWVLNKNEFKSDIVLGIGLYGKSINVSCASKGGWSKFGIDRKITSSKNNILFELDNKPALQVYKTYLGQDAKDLPSSGLLYPLMIESTDSTEPIVRTILAVDEANDSITFAGDMPENSNAMFMKASFAQLINGANDAISNMELKNYKNEPAINIAISCIGRKLVLGQKTEDEIEIVFDGLAHNVEQIGYYSYGEISPHISGNCDLHNQTMTITLIWES